jgi:methylphosphotriester-DNA--protein-cysteine methyltransferase
MKSIVVFLIIGLSLLVSCGKSEKEPTFVGNSETKVVHRITCSSAANMKAENKVMFKTYKKAKGEGYKACEICDPDEKKK